MSAPRRRIAFLGLFGVGNIGNEASLASGIHAVRRRDPDAEIVVISAVPDVVEAEHGVPAVSILMAAFGSSFGRFPRPVRALLRPIVECARWIDALRFTSTVDKIVVPGTGILDDFGMSPWAMPWDLVRWSTVARLRRRPFMLLSIGAGPIEHRLSRRFARWTVRNADLCTYRDEVSRQFMTTLGCPSPPDAELPDLVFSLERPEQDHRPGGRRCVGVGVMAYYGWSNAPDRGADTLAAYVSAMAEITTQLLDDGADVRLLVGEHTDQLAVADLLGELERRRPAELDRVAAPRIESVAALLEQINGTDGVVATRYHNVVGAMMMHRPVVAIAYAEKHLQLIDGAGLPGARQWIDAIDAQRIVADLDAQMADPEPIAARLAEWDAVQHEAVERQYDQVFGTSEQEKR